MNKQIQNMSTLFRISSTLLMMIDRVPVEGRVSMFDESINQQILPYYISEQDKVSNEEFGNCIKSLREIFEKNVKLDFNGLIQVFCHVLPSKEYQAKEYLKKEQLSILISILAEQQASIAKSERTRILCIKGFDVLTGLIEMADTILNKITSFQNQLELAGAVDLALSYLSSSHSEVLMCGLRLSKYMLLKGNYKVQKRFDSYLTSGKDESIFYVFEERLKMYSNYATEVKRILKFQRETEKDEISTSKKEKKFKKGKLRERILLEMILSR